MSITMTSLRDALFVDLVNRGYFGESEKKNNQKSTGLTQIEAKSNTRALFVRVLDGYRFF